MQIKIMSKKIVRTAVVGMGIGRPNGQAIARNPRGQIVALCDIVEERMKDFAKDLPEKVKFYTSYEKIPILMRCLLAHRISCMFQ